MPLIVRGKGVSHSASALNAASNGCKEKALSVARPLFQLCVKEGGACVTTLDGYYVESVVCVLIGFAWWVWFGPKMKKLQTHSPAAWRCRVVTGYD